MLSGKASLGMLPTPNSRDFKDAQTPEKYQARKEKWAEKGINLQLSLPQLVKNQMLPTPTTRDCKSGQSPNGMIRKDGKSRADQLNNLPVMLGKHTQQTGETSQQLNPQFVLEMMGFPTDWTLLPFLNGETNPSKPEETP
jgi:hypothetical protein